MFSSFFTVSSIPFMNISSGSTSISSSLFSSTTFSLSFTSFCVEIAVIGSTFQVKRERATRSVLFLIQFLFVLPHDAIVRRFRVIASTRYPSPGFAETTEYFGSTDGLLVVVNVLLHEKQDTDSANYKAVMS